MKKPASILDTLTMDQMSAVGRRIVDLRNRLNQTQKEFADKLNVSQSYISLLEAGQKPLTKSAFEKIVSVINVNPEWLLYGESTSEDIFTDRSKEKSISEKFIVWFQSLPLDRQAILAKCVMEISEVVKDYPPGS